MSAFFQPVWPTVVALGCATQHASSVSFADFVMTVPPPVRLLLAIVITVGVALLFVWRFHSRILTLGGWPTPAYDDPIVLEEPRVGDLVGRVLALTMFAFVFLLAFTLSNFWGAQQATREATQNESAHFDRVSSVVALIPAGQGREEIEAGLAAYRHDVIDKVHPVLQQADVARAAELQRAADLHLVSATTAAYELGAYKSPAWAEITSDISDLVSDGQDRVNAMPSGNTAQGALLLIFLLGLTNLVLTAMWVPAPLKNTLVLIGIMATLTAVLLFVVVEASNPFIGAGTVSEFLPLPIG